MKSKPETGENIPSTAERTSPLGDAYNLVHGDRGGQYGHPYFDMGRMAQLCNIAFRDKLKEPLSRQDMTMFYMLGKLSRLIQDPTHFDSHVDLGGYAECSWMVHLAEEKARLGLLNENTSGGGDVGW